MTAFCTLAPTGKFEDAKDDGTRVVTRAKYLSSDGICHGSPPARPMPFEWVAATIIVNGRRDCDMSGLVVVTEIELEEDIDGSLPV